MPESPEVSIPKHVPKWILTLPPGNYCMRDLMKITGLNRANINRYLKKFGVKVEPHRHTYSNIIYYIYIWEGYK